MGHEGRGLDPGACGASGGHPGSGRGVPKSTNLKPAIVGSACDQTIWDADARMGL